MTYRIVEVRHEGPQVRTWRFNGPTPAFLPGQFAVATLAGATASLTLCSSPLDRSGFEVTVKRMGTFGTLFYDQAAPGLEVDLRPPTGPFCLRPQERRPLCFIGRDYTVPAARSMVRWMADSGHLRPFTLLHEVTTPGPCLYQAELAALGLPGFQHRVLAGELTPAIVEEAVEDVAGTVFFVAGEGPDVKRHRALLLGMGVPAASIQSERWS